MKVYLAGGMHSNWREPIKQAMACYDPHDHGCVDEQEYTAWDLAGIRRADVLFAYLDADNPSGYGMATEIGYARALGKLVIFVCEPAHPQHQYFGMCRAMADVTYTTLEDGIHFLLTLKSIA